MASRETTQALWTKQSTIIREMSKIGIRLLIKRGSLRVGRELLVETVGETSVLSWGFLRPVL